MELFPKLTDVLKAQRRYFYLRTEQTRDVISFGKDKDKSVTRGYIRSLLKDRLIARHEPRLIPAGQKTAPPIHTLTCKGSSVLAAQTGDTNDLLLAETSFRDWMSLHHFCEVASFHIALDRAIANQTYVKSHGLIFEHEVKDPREREPNKRYKLYQTFPNSPVVCVPDSAIELEVKGRRVIFLEREMGSDTPSRVASKKAKGYHQMLETGKFTTNFPNASSFRVLAVCPNRGWASLLMHEMKDRPGAEMWLFVAEEDALNSEKVLHGPVCRQWKKTPQGMVDSGPIPLIAPPVATAVRVNTGGNAGAVLTAKDVVL
jgi:hypothetical protein